MNISMLYPEIDPVALELGPLKIHWYGLMYLLGFAAVWWLGQVRAKSTPGWQKSDIGDLVFYGAIGVVVGGRMGYILFYNFSGFLDNPLSLFMIWEGGMSFHGGFLGVLAAMWWYGRKNNKTFFQVTDFLAPFVPIGLCLGRIGNFINGELWGRPTELPWGMIFPNVDDLARHPSSLYQATLEGPVLFILLWWFSSQPRPLRAVSGLFLIGYGGLRFISEFARQPDEHLGFIAFDWLTMGQLLSLPMVIIGVVLLSLAYRKETNIKPS